MLGLEPLASHVLQGCSDTELCLQSLECHLQKLFLKSLSYHKSLSLTEIALHSICRVGLCFSVQCFFQAACIILKPVECLFHSKQWQIQHTRWPGREWPLQNARMISGIQGRYDLKYPTPVYYSFSLRRNIICTVWKQ